MPGGDLAVGEVGRLDVVGMEIRNATEADLPRIVEIYNSTVPTRNSTADLEPVPVESRLPWFRDHDPERRPIWVAEESVEEEVAGWLSFGDFYGRPAYHATAEIGFYVSEAHRRRGIGRLLLSKAVRRAPSLGLKTLLGFAFDHNAPSLALLESFGFARWGHLPRIAELDGVERGLVMLGLRLDEPSGEPR